MDETALFYKLLPCHTLSDKPVSGKKLSKERLTVAFCMNATGNDKLPPLVINKSKRPRSFGKHFNPNTICAYYYNPKAWMNMIIFKDWLLKQNKRFKSRGRKILMLVDNAGGHNISLDLKVELTHITLYYLPPNTTSEFRFI